MGLGQKFIHHAGPGDLGIGQSLFPSGVQVVQSRVIQAQLVQDRGVQVGDSHPIFNRPVAEFVCRSMDVAPLEAPTGQQQAEGVPIVVATIAPLGDGESAEFTGPQHNHIVEQSPLFQRSEERRVGKECRL